MDRPKVGVGIIIQNEEDKILVGKRIGGHAQYYSIPGGHLELGETFEEAAIKEVFEETGLTIQNPKVFCVTNNLDTYKKENKHYISVNLYSNTFSGTLKNKEPEKCEGWDWYDLNNLPYPHFDASAYAIECFLKNTFYIEKQNKKDL